MIRPLRHIALPLLCFFLMAALPLAAYAGGNPGERKSSAVSSDEEKTGSSTVSDCNTENVFRIKNTSTGIISEIPDKDFCIGALAYEMQPSFGSEALKAQTVALYTFFCRKRNIAREKGQDHDFAADTGKGEIYLSDDLLRKKWGSQYDTSIKAIKTAVEAVFGEIMTDSDGDPIDACYHAISGGATENAADVFGQDDPHLIAAASPFDTLAPGYLSVCSFSAEEFRSKLSSVGKNIKLADDPSDYIGEISRTGSGTVTKLTAGGQSFSGLEIRKAFSLRSAVFDIEYKDNNFIFTVRGYGHGVGLSQWGARGMAQQGSDHREILRHYYSDFSFSVNRIKSIPH